MGVKFDEKAVIYIDNLYVLFMVKDDSRNDI